MCTFSAMCTGIGSNIIGVLPLESHRTTCDPPMPLPLATKCKSSDWRSSMLRRWSSSHWERLRFRCCAGQLRWRTQRTTESQKRVRERNKASHCFENPLQPFGSGSDHVRRKSYLDPPRNVHEKPNFQPQNELREGK